MLPEVAAQSPRWIATWSLHVYMDGYPGFLPLGLAIVSRSYPLMSIFAPYSLGCASPFALQNLCFIRRLSKDAGRSPISTPAGSTPTKTTTSANGTSLKAPKPPAQAKSTPLRPNGSASKDSKAEFGWRMFLRDTASKPSTSRPLAHYWFPHQPRRPITLSSDTGRAQFPRSPLDIWVDASPLCGLGIIIGHRWAAWRLVGSESLPPTILDNNDLEFFAIEFAVYHLAHDVVLRRADVCIRGDNLSVIRALTNRTSTKGLWKESIGRIHKCLDQAELTLNLKSQAR
ncbi:hypothetical protein DENSPDRAFT_270050 [Dentipellis sp. KUC8613]|nr:hypothetical protein DENSPDRAFT_270050 [Dentipellis sp. KUC8613]